MRCKNSGFDGRMIVEDFSLIILSSAAAYIIFFFWSLVFALEFSGMGIYIYIYIYIERERERERERVKSQVWPFFSFSLYNIHIRGNSFCKKNKIKL